MDNSSKFCQISVQLMKLHCITYFQILEVLYVVNLKTFPGYTSLQMTVIYGNILGE